MVPSKQWTSWLKVFIFMSIFTLLQIPLSQVALGGTTAVKQESRIQSTACPEAGLIAGKPPAAEQNTPPEEQNQAEVGRSSEQADRIIKKPVYLTIDDGPSGVSAKFLDLLEQYEVKATFFLLEPRVRTYPELVRRMTEEGHRLGSHGVTHDVRKFYASCQSAVSEFNITKEALREATGLNCILARTPYGSAPYLSREQEEAVLEEGYQIWDWNVDSRDWYYRDEDYVYSTIEQVERLTARGTEPVILIHELETTGRHLKLLIEYLLDHDYEFRTLDERAQPVRLR